VIDDTVDEAVLDRYTERYRCDHYFAQPCMNDDYARHLERTMKLVHARPRWRMSVQLHKILGVP
jgi:organic radical activating enzyme